MLLRYQSFEFHIGDILMRVVIAIPTYNGGALWRKVAGKIADNINDNKNVVVIDSQSKDDTVQIAEQYGFETIIIPSSEFNHGSTRNLVVGKIDADIVIFLTQDALPIDGFVDEIVKEFNDIEVAAVYGRQLPHVDANPLAIHARYFNYKKNGYVCSLIDKDKMGLKTVFMSNSFSAYRVSNFKEIGGFPSNTILSEDMCFAAKAIKSGYKISYSADAKVQHSHNYTPIEEFKRYFDIGVFHHDESWIREEFGGAGGEGMRFIRSEAVFLLKNNPLWIPRACLHNFLKIIGYKIGQNYKRIPSHLIPYLSMHKRFWK